MVTGKTLRQFVVNGVDDYITDTELELLSEMHTFEFDFQLEHVGNFILTKCIETFEKHKEDLCCGIGNQSFIVPNDIIYYAFDYGH